MAFTNNGFGNAYYGREDERPDGSYVTTEYFVLFRLPLFRRKSYRVRPIMREGPRHLFESSQALEIMYEVPGPERLAGDVKRAPWWRRLIALFKLAGPLVLLALAAKLIRLIFR